MAEINRFSRWLVNHSNRSRSARLFEQIAPALSLPPSPRVLEIGSGAGGLGVLVYERVRPLDSS